MKTTSRWLGFLNASLRPEVSSGTTELQETSLRAWKTTPQLLTLGKRRKTLETTSSKFKSANRTPSAVKLACSTVFPKEKARTPTFILTKDKRLHPLWAVGSHSLLYRDLKSGWCPCAHAADPARKRSGEMKAAAVTT